MTDSVLSENQVQQGPIQYKGDNKDSEKSVRNINIERGKKKKEN